MSSKNRNFLDRDTTEKEKRAIIGVSEKEESDLKDNENKPKKASILEEIVATVALVAIVYIFAKYGV